MFDPRALSDVIITWSFNDSQIIPRYSYNYEFFCPYPSRLISNLIDRYIDRLPKERIAQYLTKREITEDDLDESQEIEIVVSSEAIIQSYLRLIKESLECFMDGMQIKTIAPIKFVSKNRLLVGLDDASGEKLTEFLNSESDNSNQVITEVGDYLDIWGSKLNDTRYLIEILVHLGIAELSGVNYYEADDHAIQKIADINAYGDGFGWIDKNLPKILDVRAVRAIV